MFYTADNNDVGTRNVHFVVRNASLKLELGIKAYTQTIAQFRPHNVILYCYLEALPIYVICLLTYVALGGNIYRFSRTTVVVSATRVLSTFRCAAFTSVYLVYSA